MSKRNGGLGRRLACRFNDGQDARPTEESATRLTGYWYYLLMDRSLTPDGTGRSPVCGTFA